MASNLSIENLARSVQSGDMDSFFGSEIKRSNVAPESTVVREMQNNGMSVPASSNKGAITFTDMLRQSIDKVNEAQVQSDTAIKELVAGRSKNVHETLLTIERADASLKLMMQVRNKILDAYREIIRMQV